jgi:hypothetical protein
MLRAMETDLVRAIAIQAATIMLLFAGMVAATGYLLS